MFVTINYARAFYVPSYTTGVFSRVHVLSQKLLILFSFHCSDYRQQWPLYPALQICQALASLLKLFLFSF